MLNLFQVFCIKLKQGKKRVREGKEKKRERYRKIDREKEIEREREGYRMIDIEKEIERERERQKEKEKIKGILKSWNKIMEYVLFSGFCICTLLYNKTKFKHSSLKINQNKGKL